MVTTKDGERHLYLALGPQQFRADRDTYYIAGETIGIFAKDRVRSIEILRSMNGRNAVLPNIPPAVLAAIVVAYMTFRMGTYVVAETKQVFHKAQALISRALHPHRKDDAPADESQDAGKEKP